jgi:hypothetical protein
MILLQAAGTGMSSLIMFGMIFAVMYFFMIRPQIIKKYITAKIIPNIINELIPVPAACSKIILFCFWN